MKLKPYINIETGESTYLIPNDTTTNLCAITTTNPESCSVAFLEDLIEADEFCKYIRPYTRCWFYDDYDLEWHEAEFALYFQGRFWVYDEIDLPNKKEVFLMPYDRVKFDMEEIDNG